MSVKTGFIFRRTLWTALNSFMMLILLGGVAYLYLSSQLPPVEALNDVHLQVPLRIYSLDKQLIAEYGQKRRIPIKINDVPKPLIDAILSTEDNRFFEHPGVDMIGLMRAAVSLVRTGRKSQGGSTITMQVARNFFLSRRKTYIRKVNEILLAIKIDHELPKETVLELYLNKIYFGNRAYGVAAAAQVYYGKKLQDLSLAQMAMIAGLPKAPSRINPLANPAYALKRRTHVLQRMVEVGRLSEAEFEKANRQPLPASYHGRKIQLHAPHVAEMIRQGMLEQFGRGVYTKGYQVFTTIDTPLQQQANTSLHNGLIAYDRRHGFRGPLKNLGEPRFPVFAAWSASLAKLPRIVDLLPSAVLSVTKSEVSVLLSNGDIGTIPFAQMAWAREQITEGRLGKQPTSALQILQPGDVVYVQAINDHEFRLAQKPEVEGALVSLDPQTGAIKALVGGFDFKNSRFNRVVQANRQPGSAFKPFIYAAALDKGYTLASIINDAPIVFNDPSSEKLWRPQNANHRFYGPTRLRVGFTNSRNLVSIRLLDEIGLDYAIQFLERFGLSKRSLPHSLSLALGSVTLSPLELTTGYAVLANGGFQVKPYIIHHVTDSNGAILVRAEPKRACLNCVNAAPVEQELLTQQDKDALPRLAKQVLDPKVAFLMNQAMKDVIKHGTAKAAKVLKRPDLAGKTGTTNDQVDGWFAGFNTKLVTTVWVGFDTPHSLYEYASKTALPIWVDYMRTALKGVPPQHLPQPRGLVSVRIDAKTGLLATPNTEESIFELFREGSAPRARTTIKPTNDATEEQPIF